MTVEADKEEVLRANLRFYQALGSRDLNLMDSVWVRDARSGCVHPGWVMLKGWEALRQSWENVFDPNDKLDIELSSVTVDVNGDIAWVTCVQKLVYKNRIPVGINVSQSTNIFERQESGWLMVVHHASPIPITDFAVREDKLQ